MRGVIIRKSQSDLQKMRAAGAIHYKVLAALKEAVKPGVSTLALDELAERIIVGEGAKPSFKGYVVGPRTFHHSVCISVNEAVVHGVPSADQILQEGDIVGLDLGVKYLGFHADGAVTLPVGQISDEARQLMDVTRKSLYAGIAAAVPGSRVGSIGAAVQATVDPFGYGIVRTLTGHGIGRNLHEPPSVFNFGSPNQGEVLRSGYTLAIEPMINLGTHQVREKSDGWTIVTTDGKLSAHFEHTIVVREGEPEILTLPEGKEAVA